MERFAQGAALLSPRLRQGALALPAVVRSRAEELRLRGGRPPTVVLGRDELPFSAAGPVERRDLELTLELATRHSAHAALDRVRQGYFTVQGGHRIGLCGTVVTEEGQVRALRTLSSLSIRIARPFPGCGEGVLRELAGGGTFPSTLVVAPPGGGKTTLLRDLVRLLSDGACLPPMRVGLCDERGEVAALWEGVPQFDVGEHTDVLEGCPKARGLLMLLRGMGPQVLCCDEITAPGDLHALDSCANCGVTLLCTAHAGGVEDLLQKPLYRGLLERKLFRRAVVIRPGEKRTFQVEGLP